MKPYMENGFMVHAYTSLPGLKSKVMSRESKVMSRQSGGVTHFFHLVSDELTASFNGTPEAEATGEPGFKTGRNEDGPYVRYYSTDDRDLDVYMAAHRNAVELWMSLYMQDPTVPTVDRAGELAAENEDNYSRRGQS